MFAKNLFAATFLSGSALVQDRLPPIPPDQYSDDALDANSPLPATTRYLAEHVRFRHSSDGGDSRRAEGSSLTKALRSPC